MNMMRAWVLNGPGELAMRHEPIPEPREDEVLIHIDVMCICNGSDPEIYRGHEAYRTPMIFGHEASGTIVKMGAGVQGFRLGQRVCWWCTMGAFAEYTAVAPAHVAMFAVPENVTREQSPVLELVIAASRALMPFTEDCRGKRLLIMGLGPSGLTAVQYAKALGFSEVFGWDLYQTRRERALEVNCDQVFDPSEPDFDALISAMPEADIAIDMMGDELLGASTFTKMLRRTKPGGTIVSYGHPEHGRIFSPFVFQSRDLTMVSPEGRLPVIREKGAALMEFVRDGKIRVQPLITDVRAFDELGDSFRALLDDPGSEIKLIFTV